MTAPRSIHDRRLGIAQTGLNYGRFRSEACCASFITQRNSHVAKRRRETFICREARRLACGLVGLERFASAEGQTRLVPLVGLKIVRAISLVQAQRFDCRFIDCSRDWQTVIALEIRDSGPRVNAQGARYWSRIIACILQRCLDVRDHLVREQITVSVDWPIVVVIGLQWIVAIGWIPVASVKKVVSRGNENDRVTMIVPPVTVVPLVPVTAKRFVKADRMLFFVVPFFAVGVFR